MTSVTEPAFLQTSQEILKGTKKKKKAKKSQKRRKIIHISNKMQHTFFLGGVYHKENLNIKKKAIKKRGKNLYVKRNAM
jgi:hypothetical protein